MMSRSTMSIMGSSPSSTAIPLPYSKSVSDFEVERSERFQEKRLSYAGNSSRAMMRSAPDYNNEILFQTSVAKLIAAKAHPFAISGHIPFDPSSLTVFFRSQSGITHSLDFPIDVEFDTPPALDVLIAACKPHATCELDGFSDRESLFYPPTLALTSTLELSNHPILEATRTTLFPSLATGHYLTAVRDKLEIIPSGGHMCPQRRIAINEGKVATIIVTLPVRFRGGGLVVHDFEGHEEKFYGRGGKPGDIEWTAFLADCDHEVETVQKGCRVTISYNVYLRTFGPSQSPSNTLTVPSDRFLDTISPILNMSRGRRIAFYLTEHYGFSPADILAESLVPHLKGGDSLLYHSLKLYKLAPELRWTAGGYIWPVDRTVECGSAMMPLPLNGTRSPLSSPLRRRPVDRFGAPAFPTPSVTSPTRAGFSIYADPPQPGYSDSDEEETETLRSRVEKSGAIPLLDAEILIVADKDALDGAITKERVPYVSGGALDKLIVNVLLVVYVP